MQRSLRICVAEDDADIGAFYQQALVQLGHEVMGIAATSRELISLCAQHKPDLVIADIRMPDSTGIEAASEVCRQTPTPFILVSAYHDQELIANAQRDYIMAYLVKPIQLHDLETSIAVAMHQFEQSRGAKSDAESLRQALQDRKLIERAKGVLMKHAGLSEEDAFKRLQKLSWDRNQKLVDIAQLIITANQAIDPAQGTSSSQKRKFGPESDSRPRN